VIKEFIQDRLDGLNTLISRIKSEIKWFFRNLWLLKFLFKFRCWHSNYLFELWEESLRQFRKQVEKIDYIDTEAQLKELKIASECLRRIREYNNIFDIWGGYSKEHLDYIYNRPLFSEIPNEAGNYEFDPVRKFLDPEIIKKFDRETKESAFKEDKVIKDSLALFCRILQRKHLSWGD
jgi:hypothetical protein